MGTDCGRVVVRAEGGLDWDFAGSREKEVVGYGECGGGVVVYSECGWCVAVSVGEGWCVAESVGEGWWVTVSVGENCHSFYIYLDLVT